MTRERHCYVIYKQRDCKNELSYIYNILHYVRYPLELYQWLDHIRVKRMKKDIDFIQ